MGGGWTDFFQEVKLLKAQKRSIKRIANITFKTVGRVFTPAPNSTYKADDLTKALIGTCVRNSSAEQCGALSPDTMLRRLRQVDEKALGRVLEGLNNKLLRKLDLRRRVVMALDFRTLPYYGGEQPSLVSDSRLPGTRFGVRFAMLSVVEEGCTFVLGVKQVTPFYSKAGIIREMLGRAPVRPRMLLLDREFYAVEVIKALRSWGTHFLMAAKRTAPIKRLCERFERGEIPPVVDYLVSSFGSSVQVKLIFIKRRTKRGWETHVFVSDQPLNPETASGLYSCRWRIETNNREVKKFMARTTSRNMKLRRIYYSLAALLYNLWIVMRHALGELRSREFKLVLNVRLVFSSVVRMDDPPPPL